MHWIYPSIGSAIFGFGLGALSNVALCVTVDSYEAVSVSHTTVSSDTDHQQIAGEAFIGVAFMRNVFSIAISFALVPWLEAQGLRNMTVTMGVWALLMGFLHVPLQIWGKKIRGWTEVSYRNMVPGGRI